MMVLEWIRRHSPVFDTNIKTYVGAKGPILAVEKAAESGGGGRRPRPRLPASASAA